MIADTGVEPPPRRLPARSVRGRMVIIGVVLFSSYAYFYEAGGWNQNTRFDLVRAIVEQGTIRIDAFYKNSGDRAPSGGHFYADKAPGASLMAVPAVFVAREALLAYGRSGRARQSITFLSYVATLTAAALPATVASLCLFAMARRMGGSDSAAAVAALTYGLGTPLWAFATLFFGHALAAGCLMVALLAAYRLHLDAENPRRDVLLGGVVGLGAGWAVVTEFPSAIAAIIIAALVLAQTRRSGRARLFRVGGALVGGAAVCAAVLVWYQWSAFGSPFHVSYASEENTELLRAGFFGITLPKPHLIAELLWGSYRGLLPIAPALIVAPIGLWMLWRRRETRGVSVAAVAISLLMLLLNAAYEHWEGGWSYGPRHLVPVLGLVCLGIAPVWMRAGSAVRVLVLGLALAGVASSLIAVSTTPQPPADYHRPMQELLWPAFRDGLLSLNRTSFLDYDLPGGWAGLRGSDAPRAAWNLGERMGLKGLWSLLPLLGVWTIAGAAWAVSRQDRLDSCPAVAAGPTV